MRVSLYLLLFYVCYMACNGDQEAEEEANRKKILDQLTKTRTVLLDDYHLVTRQIATDVYMYRSYRTVSVVFYPVMRDVSDARFTFQAEELHLNTIGRCSPESVIINIKHGSYPAVNPDGYDFPKGFLDPNRREPVHTVELLSDGTNTSYVINNPKPGNWYALAYIKWEDPRTQKVEQQGLVADCHTILYTDLQVKLEENIQPIDCVEGLTVSYSVIPTTFKCMTVGSVEPIDFRLTVTDTLENDTDIVTVVISALSMPTPEDNLLSCFYDPKIPKDNNTINISFVPHPNAWHYIRLERAQERNTKFNHCDIHHTRTELDEIDNKTVTELMRDSKGRFFTFEYGLPTTDLQDSTSLVNLTSNEVQTLSFKVTNFLDIGGSLALEASLLMSLKYYMGYKRELRKGSLLAFSKDNPFMRVVICLDIGHTSVPLPTGHCQYNEHVKPALFVLNTTDSSSIYDKVIIPFPEAGRWFLTFRLFCDEVVCPCRSLENDKYLVNTEGGDSVGGEEDLGGEATREGETQCNATVVLSVTSSSCVGGRCGNHGSCLLNTYGGLIMSFCSCSAGYGAWDCSDDSRMDSRVSMIVSVLLLTLSNLLFFFSIYVATIRLYYTEAVMYAFTMVFSTFYHACDADSQVAYCIARPNILQFGDFYCGIMCFWVTLLAMSIVQDKLRSSLQLIGAIVIALLTTWNMHSITTFILPVAIGCVILFLSWWLNWRKTHVWMYKRSYYTIFLPIGLVLVGVGLICYAFLQTEQNYKIVHSVWHMIIAASVVFLLPDAKRDPESKAFLPSPHFCKVPFFNNSDRSRNPITAE